MNNRIKPKCIGLLSLLIFSIIILGVCPVFAQSLPADSKLKAADNAFNEAFTAVVDAQNAGGDVSSLLAKLNGTAAVLALADMDYAKGDLNAASAKAESVLPVIQQVAVEARAVQESAAVSGRNALLFTLGFSVIGSVVFVSVLFLVWKWFKRRYVKNLPSLKPEAL